VLASIQPTPDQYEWFKKVLQARFQDKQEFHEEAIERAQKSLAHATKVLSRLYDDFIEELIDKHTYKLKRQHYLEKKQKLRDQLANLDKASEDYMAKGVIIL
jgi:hypothetical protein